MKKIISVLLLVSFNFIQAAWSEFARIEADGEYCQFERSISPDGHSLLSFDKENGSIILRELGVDGVISRKVLPRTEDSYVPDWPFSPNGNLLAVLDNKDLHLMEIPSGELKFTVKGGGGTFISDDLFAVSYANPGIFDQGYTFGLVGLRSGTFLKKSVKKEGGSPICLLASPNKEFLAIDATDALDIWRLSDGELVQTLSLRGLTKMAFSPDSTYLAVAWSFGVKVFQLQDGMYKEVQDLYRSSDCDWVGFSSDGELLMATYVADSSVFRTADWKEIFYLENNEVVRQTIFSSTGYTVFSSTGLVAIEDHSGIYSTNNILIREVLNGREEMLENSEDLSPLQFSQDGKFLLAINPRERLIVLFKNES